MNETHILVTIKKKRVELWEIIHDMPETPGLCIMDAFENWRVRTKKPCLEDFLKYVRSKGFEARAKKVKPKEFRHRWHEGNV